MGEPDATSLVRNAVPLAGLFDAFRDRHEPEFLNTIRQIADADAIPGVMEVAELIYQQAAARKAADGDLLEDLLPLNNLCCLLQYNTCPALSGALGSQSFNDDGREIQPFLGFIWLLVKSLELLPPYELTPYEIAAEDEEFNPYEQPPGGMVRKKVKGNLEPHFPVGREFTWHCFTNAMKMEVGDPWLLDEDAEDEGVELTIFHIELTQKQARDISRYSTLREQDVLLPPGFSFKVMHKDSFEFPPVTFIYVQEVRSHSWIMDIWRQASPCIRETSDSVNANCESSDQSSNSTKIPDGMQKIMNVFARYDFQSSRKVSCKELRFIMVQVGMQESSVEILISMAAKHDHNDLDFVEFLCWIYGCSSSTCKDIGLRAPAWAQESRSWSIAGADARVLAIDTLSGDSYELCVTPDTTASELWAQVAKKLGIPKLETGLIDANTGALLHFGDPAPMKAIPARVTAVRSKHWAGVPPKLHHPALTVSEDRRRVEHAREFENAGCYLTAPLERGGRYKIDFCLDLDYDVHCVWLGITSDRVTKWSYLKGCWFTQRSGYWTGVWDDFFELSGDDLFGKFNEQLEKTAVYREDRLLEILSAEGSKSLRMVVDTCIGRMELLTLEDELLIQHSEPGFLIEDALRICVSFLEPGASLTIIDCHAD